MNQLCKKIRQYISSDDIYHLTKEDKNNILISIIKCQWLLDFLSLNYVIKYNDLLLMAILCSNNNEQIARKILKYGISHNNFNIDFKKCIENKDTYNKLEIISHIDNIKSISYYDKCLSFACRYKFDSMVDFILKLNPVLCSTCLNIFHKTDSLCKITLAENI